MSFEHINVDQAKQLIDDEAALVIDIRDPASYQAGHIGCAELITNENIETFVQKSDLNKPLIVCCFHGNMSQGAADYFNRRGFDKTYSLDGGYEAWKKSTIESVGK